MDRIMKLKAFMAVLDLEVEGRNNSNAVAASSS
jgi:hypothetical protein